MIEAQSEYEIELVLAAARKGGLADLLRALFQGA